MNLRRSFDQSFIGHLEELRRRILVVLAFFVVALIASFVFVGKIYNFLVGPAHGQKLTVLGPGDVISVYFMIAGVTAFILTIPFLLWQLWIFVRPGLREQERKYAKRLLLPVLIMLLLGASFGFFVVFPEIYHFLKQLAIVRYDFMITATEYFSFLFDVVIPFALIFELPVVVMFLTRIGLLTPKFMRKMRRYAYFACIVLGTLISPPELISHLSVTVPMILLYEISIGISAFAYRKKEREMAKWYEDPEPVGTAPVAAEKAAFAQAPSKEEQQATTEKVIDLDDRE